MFRNASVGDAAKLAAPELHRRPLPNIPSSVASRMAVAWTEGIGSCLANDHNLSFLGRYRSRLLSALVPKGGDRNTELEHRLRLWEHRQFDELGLHVIGQEADDARRR